MPVRRQAALLPSGVIPEHWPSRTAHWTGTARALAGLAHRPREAPLKQLRIDPVSGPASFEKTTLRRIHGLIEVKPEVGAIWRANAGLGAKVALRP